ncbi:MAG: SLOG family protein [Acutalibacteraceae bacterium]|nr:SLOG family protein [Acutalibacteraceae bacterium]
MEKEKTCCFIINDFCAIDYLNKSSAAKEKISEKLKEEICRLKEIGVTSFITGCEAGIDLDFAQEVLKDKNLSLFCVCAYEEQSSSYGEKEREKYYNVINQCNDCFLVSKQRDFGCKNKRDKFMIDRSDYILCYWDKISPYTGELLQYAAANDKKIAYI